MIENLSHASLYDDSGNLAGQIPYYVEEKGQLLPFRDSKNKKIFGKNTFYDDLYRSDRTSYESFGTSHHQPWQFNGDVFIVLDAAKAHEYWQQWFACSGCDITSTGHAGVKNLAPHVEHIILRDCTLQAGDVITQEMGNNALETCTYYAVTRQGKEFS